MKTAFLQKTIKACVSILLMLGLHTASIAQASKQHETIDTLLDYSRPGSAHAILGKLAGTWSFQDVKLAFVRGTLVRRSIYNDRFYTVEIIGGKLPVPVADGKMKVESYQGMQIEGFDNPRGKYYTSSINNHIGSDIQLQSGTFDAATQTFTYDWDDELIPGQITKNRRVLIIKDSAHYTELFYEFRNNEYIQVRELDYSKLQ